MTVSAATEATAGAGTVGANKVRSKNGVARTDLKTIDDQAGKIWTVARKTEVAEVQIARGLSGKADALASGGGWRARIAALRLYGVVTKTREGYFKMTDLGIALANVGDEVGHLEALRTAVMSIPANASILRRYEGGELPSLDTLATEFEFTYSMSSGDANSAAKVFIASAKYSGLVDDSDFVHRGNAASDTDADDGPLEDLYEDMEASDEQDSATGGADEPRAAESEPFDPSTTYVKQDQAPRPPEASPVGASPVGLNVKLDMSAWAVDDVLRVLAVLGFEAPSGSE